MPWRCNADKLNFALNLEISCMKLQFDLEFNSSTKLAPPDRMGIVCTMSLLLLVPSFKRSKVRELDKLRLPLLPLRALGFLLNVCASSRDRAKFGINMLCMYSVASLF